MDHKNIKSFKSPAFSDETFFKLDTQYDMVNSPAHYTHGRVEAIDVIEDSFGSAPSPLLGFLLGQVL